MMKLTEKEARTIIAVFYELKKRPYSEINSYLGSLTIEEMDELYFKLRREYGYESELEY